jgi:hypothetical protein
MSRLSQLLITVGCTFSIYVGAFGGYRTWAERTSAERPHGVPAWHFMYPSKTPGQRALYALFYPCIRLDQLWQDAKNHNV